MSAADHIEAVFEAVLFVATQPVSRDRLYELFPEEPRDDLETRLEAVLERYEGESRGVVSDEAAGGLRLVSRPDLSGYLRKFFAVSSRQKLSMAAVETLAIVAYRQPVTAPEIEELRGVNSSGVLKTLLEHRLIRISGRRDVVGKPFLYATTKEFLLRFGLHELGDLPVLEEFEERLANELGDGGEDREEQVLMELAQAEDAESL